MLQAQLVEAVEDTGFEASILRQGACSDTVQLRVDGMTCGSCSAAIEKAVRAAPGVLAVSVNLIAGTAEVRCWGSAFGARYLAAVTICADVSSAFVGSGRRC